MKVKCYGQSSDDSVDSHKVKCIADLCLDRLWRCISSAYLQ